MDRRFFPLPLDLRDAGLRGDTRLFELLGPYRYVSSYGIIEAPEGFITDGASIPRAFWNLLSPFGPWFGPAVIHDVLYTGLNVHFTRAQADLIFREAMFNAGLDWPRREAIYRAVRLFGARSYRGKKP